MYRDKDGNLVIEEDEEIYGENPEVVDKKTPKKSVPYSDVCN